MLDNFTVVFRASGDALFYVVGDSDEVRKPSRSMWIGLGTRCHQLDV
jgi:hypothetical protein